MLVELFANSRGSGSYKAGTAPLFPICRQCELRNQKHAAVYLSEREIHLALIVGKYTHLGALFCQESAFLFTVALVDAQQDQQSSFDRADCFAVDADTCLA